MWFRTAVTLSIATTFLAAGLQGQVVQDTVPCDGQTINSILLNPLPPAVVGRSTTGVRHAVMSVLFQSSVTDQDVVRAFVMVKPGERCNAERVAEAMRVLRVQPFIATAVARTVADTGGGVRLEIETTDEIPVVLGGSLSGGLSAITVGNNNVAGAGVRGVARWRDGGFYRDAFGLELRKHEVFGWPVVLSFSALRRSLGQEVTASVSRPLFSTMQNIGWYAGIGETRSFETFVRSDAEPLSLPYKRLASHAGAVLRVGGRAAGVYLGPVVMYERDRPGPNAVAVTNTGLQAPDTALFEDRYPDITTFRAGAVAGIRLLDYVTVSGFDALIGEQDLARGLQFGVTLARGFEMFGAQDAVDYGSIDSYIGLGGGRFFLGYRGTIEAQRSRESGDVEAVVGSGRAAAYFKETARNTLSLSVEHSGGWDEIMPLQLSLGQARGGPRGYESSDLPGGRRIVARLEQRRSMGPIGRYAHWGLGAFVDVSRIWAGQVPFGRDLNARASIGVSLLAAVPAQSRRLLRLDIAAPITPGADKSWRIGISATDMTRIFWREPADVSRSRAARLPASLFGWP